MDMKHANLIVEAADELGLDVTARDGYSGRGMYGETTSGIVGNLEDIVHAIAQAAYTLGQGEELSNFRSENHGVDFIEAVGSIRLDNMGRSSMIVY